MEKLKVGEIVISKQGKDSSNYQKFKQIVKKKKIKVVVVSNDDSKKLNKLQIEKDLYSMAQ